MFAFWLNNCVEPTCEFLIQAVDAMGRRDVVTVLRQKYYGELFAKHGQRGFQIMEGSIVHLEVCIISFVYIYAHLQFAYGIMIRLDTSPCTDL